MKKLLTLFVALVMCLSLVACGGVDKQPAIDAFNSANTAFTDIVNAVNADPDAFDQELIDVMIEMSGLLSEYKGLLEGDTELTEEDIAAMVEWFGTVETWVGEVKTAYEM